MVAGEGAAGDENPLLADPLHHEAGMAVARARQVRIRFPAAGNRVQELDGGEGAVAAVPTDDQNRRLVDWHGAEAAGKNISFIWMGSKNLDGLFFEPVSPLGHFPLGLLDPRFGLEVKDFEPDDVFTVRVPSAQHHHRVRHRCRRGAVAVRGEPTHLKNRPSFKLNNENKIYLIIAFLQVLGPNRRFQHEL